MSSCSEPALVRRDAQAVDLRVRVRDGARTDARECFPEANCVVVTSGTQYHAHVFFVGRCRLRETGSGCRQLRGGIVGRYTARRGDGTVIDGRTLGGTLGGLA